MKLTMFKQFFDVENYFRNFSTTRELSKNFDLYITTNKKLALSMIENGYKPTILQKKRLHKQLSTESIKSSNFLHDYQNFIHLIDGQCFINYVLSHDMSVKCKNTKTIYQNFSHIFHELKNRKDFDVKTRKSFINTIQKQCTNVLAIKPKYQHTHLFEFNKKDIQQHHILTSSIYNTLILLPLLVDNINDFLEIKTVITSSIKKIKDYVQSHNVRIIWDDHVIHHNQENCQLFKIELLDGWNKYIEQYDVKALEMKLLQTTRNTFTKNNSEVKTIQLTQYEKITQEMINLKKQCNEQTSNQIDNIIELFKNIKSHSLPLEEYDIHILYKDALSVIEKFLSIEAQYRLTLKNVEGKTPEELMYNSLTNIENKLFSYIEKINQDKVTDLSIHHRKIQMKV